MKIAAGLVCVLLALTGGAGCTPVESPPDSVPAADTTPMTGVEKAYLEFALNHLQTVRDDIALLETLFSTPDLEDEYWKASVATLLNRIELADADIATLEPTERLQPFQDASVNALNHAAAFAKLLREMLLAGETTLSNAAAEEYVQTSLAFEEVDRLLTEFIVAHPVPDELKGQSAS